MSIIVSSTTDSQEAVNRAAGIDATPTTPQPDAAAPEQPAEEEPEEPDQEEEPDEQEEPDTAAKPKRKGGFQKKIERLEAQNEELQRMLMRGYQPQQMPPQEPQYTRPKPNVGSDEYTQSIDDAIQWHIEQREAQMMRAAQQMQQHQQMETWYARNDEFREQVKDYDDVLATTRHIIIQPDLQDALMQSENGPRLAYELARNPKELARINSLPPLAAYRALGRFEAALDAPAKTSQVSKAPPEPIRPVGRGAATATADNTPLDELPYQEYKRKREKEIAARRRQR